MSKAYAKHVTYRFEVDGATWELSKLRISGDGTPWCGLEETRKNGQEDYHRKGTLVFENDRWQWEDDEDGLGSMTRKNADAILAYVRQHGHPEMKP